MGSGASIDPASRRQRTFSRRLLVRSFLATHVPLAAAAIAAILLPGVEPVAMLLILLAATLIGTALLLVALDRELFPLELATRRLHRFLDAGELETGGPYPKAELGAFLRDIDAVCERLDSSRSHLEQLVNEDLVSGARSRRAMEVAVADLLAEGDADSLFGGGAVTLALIDLDDFKGVNDELGHATGDRVLRLVVEVVRSQLPARAVIGRWGGDEFLVAVPGVSADAVLERARRSVADALAREVGRPVTVSIGAAVAVGTDLVANVALADEALYRAKAGGRNRVELAPGPPGPAPLV